AIIGVLMCTFIGCMALVGTRALLGWPYWAALGIAVALFVRQLWIMRDRARDRCFAAFRNNNWIGGVLWLGVLLSLALR
ncbi:MAG: 4-hydroxybenzoate octaprenyltransferase, partial [Rhodanobacteraceae bacterium]